MSRYINADAIEYHEIYDGQEFVRVAYGDDIDNIPTADVVEVVPCKDCKWNKSTPHNPICSNDDMPKDVGFFCADGERRNRQECKNIEL